MTSGSEGACGGFLPDLGEPHGVLGAPEAGGGRALRGARPGPG